MSSPDPPESPLPILPIPPLLSDSVFFSIHCLLYVTPLSASCSLCNSSPVSRTVTSTLACNSASPAGLPCLFSSVTRVLHPLATTSHFSQALQLHCCPSPPLHTLNLLSPMLVRTYICFLPSAPPWHEVPLSPPPATGSWISPWPFDTQSPPRLLAPLSPPWPIIPPSPLGVLLPPAPPWSVIYHSCFATPLLVSLSSHHFVPLTLSGSSSYAFILSHSVEPRSGRPAASALSGSPSMPASSQELTPLDPLPRFLPWLLPPVTMPWAFVFVGLWWFNSCLLLLWSTIHLNTLLVPRWLLPPFPSLRRLLSSLCPILYSLLSLVTDCHLFAFTCLPH